MEEAGDARYIYQNELDKAFFQHDFAYNYFKDLPRRAASDKVFRDKAFNISRNPKDDGFQRGLASVMAYKFCDKKSSSSIIISNQQLAKEFQKLVIRKLKNKNYTDLLNTIFGVLI